MLKILSPLFFQNKNTVKIAKNLIGKFLVREYKEKIKAYMITEVEAYCGMEDKASHAHKGKTERNTPMFNSAGRWYVYLIYGMYYMLNIVTGPQNYPAAILIRCISIASLEHSRMTAINGPGKLTKKLKINKVLNNKKAVPKNDLWIEDRGVKINKKDIKKSARIGVDYAGPVWSKKKLRFFL